MNHDVILAQNLSCHLPMYYCSMHCWVGILKIESCHFIVAHEGNKYVIYGFQLINKQSKEFVALLYIHHIPHESHSCYTQLLSDTDIQLNIKLPICYNLLFIYNSRNIWHMGVHVLIVIVLAIAHEFTHRSILPFHHVSIIPSIPPASQPASQFLHL